MSSPEWIPPLEAVYAVAPAAGSDKLAKKRITQALYDGNLRAKAHSVIARYSGIGPNAAPNYITADGEEGFRGRRTHLKLIDEVSGSSSKLFKDFDDDEEIVELSTGIALLTAQFWLFADRADLKCWDWSRGYFVSTLPIGNHQSFIDLDVLVVERVRLSASGVCLNFSDLRTKCGATADRSSSLVTRSTTGRPRSELWDSWIAEAVLLIAKYGYEVRSADALAKKIEGNLIARGLTPPALSSVRSATKAVFEALQNELPDPSEQTFC